MGRPPAPGERTASGRLRKGSDTFRSEAQFQRIKEHAMAIGFDPIVTSQAGRLWMLGHLTSRHIATVDYIAKVYAAYEKHAGKGATRRIRSPSHEPSTNRTERLDETPEQTEAAEEAKREFKLLQDIIPPQPREIRDVIERLCVDDEAIPSCWMGDLAKILTMIEDCRSGTTSSIKLTRGNLPLRRRAAKQLTRDEKLAAGAYAAAPKHPKPSTLSGDAAAAAARDRAGLERILERRSAQAEGSAP